MFDQHNKTLTLVELSIAGRRDAFDQLFAAWYPRWLGFARRQCDDAASAEDAVQSAVLGMIRDIRRLKDPAAFVAWSFVIVRRCCAAQSGRTIKQREVSRSLQMIAEQQSEPVVDPRLTDLSVALAALSKEHQNLITLFYGYGMSVSEIASVYGVAVGTIKSRLFKAREAIKLHLQENEEHPDD